MTKFVAHDVTGMKICCICGYHANPVNIDSKKYKRTMKDGKPVYSLKTLTGQQH